jgi:hypothetical protein
VDGAKPDGHERQTKHTVGSCSVEHAVLRTLHATVLLFKEPAQIHAGPVDELPDSAGALEDDLSRCHRVFGGIRQVEKMPWNAAIAALLDAEIFCGPIGHAGSRSLVIDEATCNLQCLTFSTLFPFRTSAALVAKFDE